MHMVYVINFNNWELAIYRNDFMECSNTIVYNKQVIAYTSMESITCLVFINKTNKII